MKDLDPDAGWTFFPHLPRQFKQQPRIAGLAFSPVTLGGEAATRSPEMVQPRRGTKTRKVNKPILDN